MDECFRDLDLQIPLPNTQTVLLGQVDGELVENVAGVAAEGAKEGAVTIHDDEAKLAVVRQQGLQRLRVELVVAEVQRRVDRLERLKVNVHLLLLALVRHDRAAVHHKTVWWDCLKRGVRRGVRRESCCSCRTRAAHPWCRA